MSTKSSKHSSFPPSIQFNYDPREQTNVSRYENKLSMEEAPADFLHLLSLIAGLVGLMLRVRIASWICLFSFMASLAGTKHSEFDFKQVSSSFVFAVMGLVMNYFMNKQGIPGSFN